MTRHDFQALLDRAADGWARGDAAAVADCFAEDAHPALDGGGLPVMHCYVRDPFGNRVELVDARDAGFSAGAFRRARPR